MTNHLLNKSGAALVLGISEGKILRLVRLGQIPHVELPTQPVEVRFIEPDLWLWAASFRRPVSVRSDVDVPTVAQ